MEELYKGFFKLIIINISLDNKDNPQLIFESLNSTGMDLNMNDLIRNYVLIDDVWDEDAILRRSEELIDKFFKIWPYPEV